MSRRGSVNTHVARERPHTYTLRPVIVSVRHGDCLSYTYVVGWVMYGEGGGRGGRVEEGEVRERAEGGTRLGGRRGGGRRGLKEGEEEEGALERLVGGGRWGKVGETADWKRRRRKEN